MSTESVNVSSGLSWLLQLQESFLGAVHSQVYGSSLARSEATLKFEINFLSEANDILAATVADLTKQLVDARRPYQLTLRDCFQKLLQADFLPLLRLNRYEITRLALFGFDIYVDPLDAVLQILARLEACRPLLDGNWTESELESGETALGRGWDAYLSYCGGWRLEFNLFMLEEYLRVGGKSFVRKDREVVFTGVSNLYQGLVGALAQKGAVRLLAALAHLNNALYYFHPSFNYFHFYSLLTPNPTLQPVFAPMVEVALKCQRTNILTPLLFGLLRHRPAFLDFIKQVNDPIWLPYLNALLAGLALNFKCRILQYEEVLLVLEAAAEKAGLLGLVRTDQVLADVDEGWRDARDFFLSAAKGGGCSGQVQTWKLVQCGEVGRRVFAAVSKAMLLRPQVHRAILPLFLQNGSEILEQQLRRISGGRVDIEVMRSSVCSVDSLSLEGEDLSLVRVVSLVEQLKLANQYSLYFLINWLIAVPNTEPIVVQRVAAAAQIMSRLLFCLPSCNFSFIREKLVTFHSRYLPDDLQGMVKLYSSCFDPRKCLNALLSLLPLDRQPEQVNHLVAHLVRQFVPKPAGSLITIRTFSQQLQVNSDLVSPIYETHCLISVLTGWLLSKGQRSAQLILGLVKAVPWLAFALLNSPVSHESQLTSLAHWLLDREEFHCLLRGVLVHGKNGAKAESGCDLIVELTYPSLCEQLSKKINEGEDLASLLQLIQLQVQLNTDFKQPTSTDMMALLLHLASKAETAQELKAIAHAFAEMAATALEKRTVIWMKVQLERRAAGRTQLPPIKRKIIKCSRDSIYFVGDPPKANSKPPTPQYYELQDITNRLNQQSHAGTTDIIKQFIQLFKSTETKVQDTVAKDHEEEFEVEELKQLTVPTISPKLLTELQQQTQDPSTELALHLFTLNSHNYCSTIQTAITRKDIAYLSQSTLTRCIAPLLPSLLRLQLSSPPFLGSMAAHLTQEEQISLGESFQLEPSLIEAVLKQERLWFLGAVGASSWRLLLEYFGKEFSRSGLPSTLLQYTEYLSITNQLNPDYQATIVAQAASFSRFVRLFLRRLSSTLSTAACLEELQLRSANELSSLNLVLAAVQLQEVLVKLGQLHRVQRERGIHLGKDWVVISEELCRAVHRELGGGVVAPDFSHGHALTSQTVCFSFKCEIGLQIEKYYEVSGQSLPKQLYYQPSSASKRILSEATDPNFKFDSTPQKQLMQRYKNLIDQLAKTNMISFRQKCISLVYQTQVSDQTSFYLLGCLHASLPQADRYALQPLLQSVIERKRLGWQLLKAVDSEQYHYLKTVLVEPEIGKKDLHFEYLGRPLVTNGDKLRVNEYNRESYCNLAALTVLAPVLPHLTALLRGYCSQLT